jgi:hypothetical protein
VCKDWCRQTNPTYARYSPASSRPHSASERECTRCGDVSDCHAPAGSELQAVTIAHRPGRVEAEAPQGLGGVAGAAAAFDGVFGACPCCCASFRTCPWRWRCRPRRYPALHLRWLPALRPTMSWMSRRRPNHANHHGATVATTTTCRPERHLIQRLHECKAASRWMPSSGKQQRPKVQCQL